MRTTTGLRRRLEQAFVDRALLRPRKTGPRGGRTRTGRVRILRRSVECPDLLGEPRFARTKIRNQRAWRNGAVRARVAAPGLAHSDGGGPRTVFEGFVSRCTDRRRHMGFRETPTRRTAIPRRRGTERARDDRRVRRRAAALEDGARTRGGSAARRRPERLVGHEDDPGSSGEQVFAPGQVLQSRARLVNVRRSSSIARSPGFSMFSPPG